MALGFFRGVLAPFANFTLPTTLDASWGLTIWGGFLVGFGAYLAGGCKSGHGICGIARSVVTTLTFMLVAAIVVFICRHVVGG
jgi:uncharacterized membrane protein YedE/YeeE